MQRAPLYDVGTPSTRPNMYLSSGAVRGGKKTKEKGENLSDKKGKGKITTRFYF
jgi:hypothetical protein